MFSFQRLRSFAVIVALGLSVTTAATVSTDQVFDSTKPKALIDYSPPFSYPTGGEVFKAGQTTSVSWDQSELYPSENVTQSADLLLGYTENGSASLHLFWTLAQDIPLYAPNPNEINVKLPANLTTRDSYLYVLLGSTNNRSPRFTILGSDASESADATETLGHQVKARMAGGSSNIAEQLD
ncbi:hypothetical protein OIV83_002367 [Microbotryomycetes sp. JL201]|nr:hypothetical protein OIV83_002367 [Microbotryomycetes sp. JL201]